MSWNWSTAQCSAEMMARLPWAVASSELRPDPDDLESGQLLSWRQNYISRRKSDWNTITHSSPLSRHSGCFDCWALCVNISRHFLTARENWPRPLDDLWVTGLLAREPGAGSGRSDSGPRPGLQSPVWPLQAAAVKLAAIITQMNRQAPNSNLLHF